MTIAWPREGDVSPDGLRVRTRLSVLGRIWAGALAVVSAISAAVFATALLGAPNSVENPVIGWFLCLAFVVGAVRFGWQAALPYEWVLTSSGFQAVAAKDMQALTKAATTDGDSPLEDSLEGIGAVSGIIAAIVAFIGVYIAAVGSVGWVFGLALGWIPALMAAVVAGVIFQYAWWLVLVGLLVVLALALLSAQ